MAGRWRGEYYKNLYGSGRGGRSWRGRGGAERAVESQHNLSTSMPVCDMSEYNMRDLAALENALRWIDGKGYQAYKDLRGLWNYGTFILYVDRVQSDSFAPPTNIRIKVPLASTGFLESLYSNKIREIATRDYICRRLSSLIASDTFSAHDPSRDNMGWSSNKGGKFRCDTPGQQVLEQSAIQIINNDLIATFATELPARGRIIMGNEAIQLLIPRLKNIVHSSFFASSYNMGEFEMFVTSIEDQEYLRKSIIEVNGIAFIANGSILCRASGNSDKPMVQKEVIPYKSPESLEVTFMLKSNKVIKGTLIKRGITIIVGGGFHGKSTLLKALALGIYNHIPNDGREFVCTDPNAVTIRAEDGRNIKCVDISPFIRDLPYGKSTTSFTTEDASGSTSIAASIIEAVEFGAKAILIDEDTAATNFLYRDKRMQMLVNNKMEPIKGLISRIKSLYDDCSCSTIMVLGSCGDYIDVADTIICMENYIPKDVSTLALNIAKKIPSSLSGLPQEKMPTIKNRVIEVLKSSPTNPHNDHYPKIRGLHYILFDKTELNLTSAQQIIHSSLTRSIAAAIHEITKKWKREDEVTELKEVLDKFEEAQKSSIYSYLPNKQCDPMDNILAKGMLAAVRRIDLAISFNRLRTLNIKET